MKNDSRPTPTWPLESSFGSVGRSVGRSLATPYKMGHFSAVGFSPFFPICFLSPGHLFTSTLVHVGHGEHLLYPRDLNALVFWRQEPIREKKKNFLFSLILWKESKSISCCNIDPDLFFVFVFLFSNTKRATKMEIEKREIRNKKYCTAVARHHRRVRKKARTRVSYEQGCGRWRAIKHCTEWTMNKSETNCSHWNDLSDGGDRREGGKKGTGRVEERRGRWKS